MNIQEFFREPRNSFLGYKYLNSLMRIQILDPGDEGLEREVLEGERLEGNRLEREGVREYSLSNLRNI
jgi:hypothetical protein